MLWLPAASRWSCGGVTVQKQAACQNAKIRRALRGLVVSFDTRSRTVPSAKPTDMCEAAFTPVDDQ